MLLAEWSVARTAASGVKALRLPLEQGLKRALSLSLSLWARLLPKAQGLLGSGAFLPVASALTPLIPSFLTPGPTSQFLLLAFLLVLTLLQWQPMIYSQRSPGNS